MPAFYYTTHLKILQLGNKNPRLYSIKQFPFQQKTIYKEHVSTNIFQPINSLFAQTSATPEKIVTQTKIICKSYTDAIFSLWLKYYKVGFWTFLRRGPVNYKLILLYLYF